MDEGEYLGNDPAWLLMAELAMTAFRQGNFQLAYDKNGDGAPDADIAVPAGRRLMFDVEGQEAGVELQTSAEGYVSPSTLLANPAAKIRLNGKSREELGVRGEGPFITEYARITKDVTADPVKLRLK
jgi:U3 small nucleolar RNA-associated protein 14